MNNLYILESGNQYNSLVEFVNSNINNLEAYDMEKSIFQKLLQIGKEMLSHYFANVEKNDVGSSISTKENEVLPRHGSQEKVYMSIFGEHKIERKRYWLKGHESVFPLDIQCNLPEQKYSYFLQEFINSLSISNAFEHASEKIDQFLNMKLHSSVLELVNRKSSMHYENFYEQKEVPELESEGEIQVASFDGKGVPMIKKEAAKIKGRQGKGEKRQKKKEALVGVSYSVDKMERTAEEVAGNLIYPENKQKETKDKKEVRAKNIRRLASIEKPKRRSSKKFKMIVSTGIRQKKKHWS